ncbi:hypothetical protein [Streptomyces sp. NPDC059076]|uniref:hypothetical protein n=1 Tax=unclassified Streptomyces TaxID=2593676 RepID=UPI0036907E23
MAHQTQSDARPTTAALPPPRFRSRLGAPRGLALPSAAGWGPTVGTVLAVYATSVAAHLLILAAMISPGGPGIRDRLLSWDGQLYTSIAADGYPDGFSYDENREPAGNNLAFFPLYPLLVRGLHQLTGIEAGTAAIAVAHLALIAALLALHALITRLHDPRTATIAIVLVAGAQPMALAFFMGYSESLFLALAAATLLATHRRAWLTAGTLALLTGLTRPAAAALTLAVVLAVVLEIRRAGRPTWRTLAAVALACAGTPLYLLWVGNRAGQLNAWFVIQEAGWGTRWDNGSSFFRFLGETFQRGDGWVSVSTAVLLVAAVCTTVIAWRRDAWPPLLVYGTTVLVLTLGQSNYYHSKLRLLIPAVLFLLPLAKALSTVRPRTLVITLTAATLFGCWYGAHMVTLWHYAI